MVDILLSIHDVLRSGGGAKWTFGRENRVRSALKLLAETCWRHRSRWRGRLKHTRAAELIGAAGESDSSVFCVLQWGDGKGDMDVCLGTWLQRGRNGIRAIVETCHMTQRHVLWRGRRWK